MDRLRSIFDGMFDGVWLVGSDGRTTYVNGAMASLLGSTPDVMRGRPFRDYVDPGRWADVDGFLDRQREQAGERMEVRLRRADGHDLFAVIAGSPILLPDGTFVGTMLNVSDVTGKHSIDAQMIQSQRLEAIGQFAGGIAHDFNNLLTTIAGYAEFVRAATPESDPAHYDIEQVLAASEMAAAITRKLLAFTRRQVLVPIDVDPGRVVTDLMPILRPLLNDDVVVVLDIDSPHGWVRADPAQLEQVMVNLALNARDAMPAGGTVTIRVHDLAPVDAARPDPDLSAGPFVRITVADTGTGMDSATRARMFDPFFSTKGPGRGTGLGLSTTFGIVAQSGGQIGVETWPGAGTTIHVDLPRVEDIDHGDPAVLALSPVQAARSTGSAGTVLLVDDNPAVREFARRSLMAAGYRVFATDSGDAALRASERWAESIDVLVTDLVMPGMTGSDLAGAILARRPGIAVVFVSGYAEDALGPDNRLTVAGSFLPKPFTVAGLVGAVDEAAVRSRGRSAD